MPLITYNNADVEKFRILKDNNGKSGVYCWVNKVNGSKYVGSSKNLYRRFLQYFNTGYLLKLENIVICRALLKHGYSMFNLEILEYCDSKGLIIREQYYIDLLKPEYNILRKAGSALGFKHREETIAKMSISKAGENPMFGRIGEKHPMFGRTGEKSHMFGKPKPEGSGSPSQQIEVIDLKTNTTTRYDSISAAALALNISRTRISICFNRNQIKPYKSQYIFKNF
ncbi:GIY endonuclease (mitochondrion) [Sclerotinia sclerotiorum 1980 UF-70]|uniref:GIY endonuclease n=1 Tax=Sclerotinia sclerotiorum (strain ATCC 18683 / 1980 / Ss-1) TaxID=665079 RepID=A0A0K0PU11_SCLS1|nr:GIY endonuclease [Sclerotinia sclerotiorum 1980 UF-70]AKQ53318.1 GIY endonuclease [Sclerotinia sclerotiorum 1980 UF-70]